MPVHVYMEAEWRVHARDVLYHVCPLSAPHALVKRVPVPRCRHSQNRTRPREADRSRLGLLVMPRDISALCCDCDKTDTG